MAKKAQKIKTDKGLALKIVNPNAAGIDVAATEMQVCVPADRDGENNRRFGSFTKDLNEISDYLLACSIDTVAMESTGVYWVPIFMLLKDKGFDVILVNPRDVKSYSDKKTDEADAEWLMLLHSYGLLKPSFQPENLARRIRNISRHRDTQLEQAAKAVHHMQKALEQMNVKITSMDGTPYSQYTLHAVVITTTKNDNGVPLNEFYTEGAYDFGVFNYPDPKLKSIMANVGISYNPSTGIASTNVVSLTQNQEVSIEWNVISPLSSFVTYLIVNGELMVMAVPSAKTTEKMLHIPPPDRFPMIFPSPICLKVLAMKFAAL